VRLVGDLQAELVEDFFEGFARGAPRERPRENDVRPLEPPQDRGPLQKPSLAALRFACSRDPQLKKVLPSTKGLL